MNKFNPRPVVPIVLLLLVILTPHAAWAQVSNNYTGANNGSWATGGNWSQGSVPTASQEVYSTNATEVRITGGTAAVANNLTIGGASSGTVALRQDNNSLAVGGSITLAPGAGNGTLRLGEGTFSGSGLSLTIGGGTGSILNGGGAGQANINVYGHVGTLGLSSASFDNLAINQSASGSLTIGSSQTWTANSGVFIGNNTANLVYGLTVNGILNTVNRLDLGAAASSGTNSATLIFNSGTINSALIQRNGTMNSVFEWNGGKITRTGGNASIQGTVGTLTINLAGTGTHSFEADGGRAITVQSTAVLADKSGEAGTFIKEGAGTLVLLGANTHSGVSTVSAGTLHLGNVNALQNSTLDTGTSGSQAVTFTVAGDNTYNLGGLQGSAALSLGANSLSVGGNNTNTTYSGELSGSGALSKAGSGTLTLSGASANTLGGTTTVSGGTLKLSKTAGVNAIAGAVEVGTGAKLLLSASDQVATANVTLSGGTIARDGNVTEVFGNLNLTAASFLDYGAGAANTLRFGTYTPTFLLTVQNFAVGNKLQFGNSISEEDLASKFSFSNGYTTGTEGSFFTITAVPEPSTIIAAAGLLGLMLWPVRHRFLLRKA